MTVDRNLKIGIISSIAATIIITYFLNPILAFAGHVILAFSSSLFATYVDRLYSQASVGVLAYPSYSLMALVFGATTGLSAGVLSGLISSTILKDRVSKMPRGLLARFLQSPVGVTVSAIVLIVLGGTLFLDVWGTWYKLRVSTSFEQHLHAVSPFITPEQEKVLRSRWAQMRGRVDYDSIYDSLRSVARQHDVRLQENTVYTLSGF